VDESWYEHSMCCVRYLFPLLRNNPISNLGRNDEILNTSNFLDGLTWRVLKE
jgi:hypothetical protein